MIDTTRPGQPRLLVEVAGDLIARGRPGQCRYCPVALGIARAVPFATHLTVGRRWVNFWIPGLWLIRLELPADVRAWIDAFDANLAGTPMGFALPLDRAKAAHSELIRRAEHERWHAGLPRRPEPLSRVNEE
jgi:hypothetical protein